MELTTVFSKEEELRVSIIGQIRKARVCIHVAVGWFSEKRIIDEMIKKLNEGLSVEVIISDKNSKFSDGIREKFTKAGGKLLIRSIDRVNNYGEKTNMMHHKFCIIDLETTIIGSYNWSENANHNDENIIIISGELPTAKKYADEFMRLKNEINKPQKQSSDLDIKDSSENYSVQYIHDSYGNRNSAILDIREYEKLKNHGTNSFDGAWLPDWISEEIDEILYRIYDDESPDFKDFLNEGLSFRKIKNIVSSIDKYGFTSLLQLPVELIFEDEFELCIYGSAVGYYIDLNKFGGEEEKQIEFQFQMHIETNRSEILGYQSFEYY